MMQLQTYPFTLPPLPYPYHALEPYIDTETMHFHHDKHFQTYIDNLNKALLRYPAYQSWTLAQLLTDGARLPAELQTPVRNNAGGVYNHDLYFRSLAPQSGVLPDALRVRLLMSFGSLADFADALQSAARGVFGSGYAWLVEDAQSQLLISTTANQDCPLTVGLTPLLPLDVWEHAYYLKHQNNRTAYIADWFQVVDWDAVAQRLIQSVG